MCVTLVPPPWQRKAAQAEASKTEEAARAREREHRERIKEELHRHKGTWPSREVAGGRHAGYGKEVEMVSFLTRLAFSLSFPPSCLQLHWRR